MTTNNAVNVGLSGSTGTGSFVGSASPTLTGTPIIPTPFTLGATSVTSTGTQLNYLSALTAVPINKVNVQVFTASGANTYTPTAGTVYAYVELWAGGGGGGASTSGTVGGGSGGGGGYAAAFITSPSSVTISIGAGGSGQAANNGTAGTDGGDTTYNTTTVVAKGGKHGANTTPGAASAAGTGTKLISGGAGASANTVAGMYLPGGQSPGLSLFNPGLPSSTAPANSGAGGTAGFSAGAGGGGGSGYAVVTEFISA